MPHNTFTRVEEAGLVEFADQYREIADWLFILMNSPRPGPESNQFMHEVATLNAIAALTATLADKGVRQELERTLKPLVATKRADLKERFAHDAEMKKRLEAFTRTLQGESDTRTTDFPGAGDWMLWYGLYLMELRTRKSGGNGKVQ